MEYDIGTDSDLMLPLQLSVFHEWLEKIVALPQVARTLPCKDRYLDHIAKYANASARSKVANAVRRGANAHEIDDDLDDCKS